MVPMDDVGEGMRKRIRVNEFSGLDDGLSAAQMPPQVGIDTDSRSHREYQQEENDYRAAFGC